MALKQKETLERQKAYLEDKLKARIACLAGRETASPKDAKDTIIRKLKADIKAISKRLAGIAEKDKRTEEMAREKAEKAAKAKAEKEEGKSEKPKKAAPVEAKPKKAKAEKAGGEGAKKKKPAEAPAAAPKAE